MKDHKIDLAQVFKDAVSRFHDVARQYRKDSGLKDRLMDAANEVFLARDDYAGAYPQSGAGWAAVVFDVKEVRDVLRKNEILMYEEARTTATGGRTYRILNNPSRFDA